MQMCDGLERNLPGELETILGNCLAHGRRKFVDVVESFPEECATCSRTRDRLPRRGEGETRSLSPAERLRLHQEASGPVMDRLQSG